MFDFECIKVGTYYWFVIGRQKFHTPSNTLNLVIDFEKKHTKNLMIRWKKTVQNWIFDTQV